MLVLRRRILGRFPHHIWSKTQKRQQGSPASWGRRILLAGVGHVVGSSSAGYPRIWVGFIALKFLAAPVDRQGRCQVRRCSHLNFLEIFCAFEKADTETGWYGRAIIQCRRLARICKYWGLGMTL
jgi:hypothetical protein